MIMPLPDDIATKRLILRKFVHEDWSALHEYYSDPECTRFTFQRTLNEAESWRAMAGMVGHWELRGYGPYAIVESGTGLVVGAAGLWFPNDWPEPEIKWALIRSKWGKGYASEAVRAIQPIAFKVLNGKPPISLINAENSASIQLALAVGASFEREMEFRGSLHHIYRHPRLPECLAAND